MANTYEKGDAVRCSAAFTTSAGVAADPTAVYFQFRTPGGTTTTYTYGVDASLVKSSTGNYYVDVNANAVGQWAYRFYSTGTGQSADEDIFTVAETLF